MIFAVAAQAFDGHDPLSGRRFKQEIKPFLDSSSKVWSLERPAPGSFKMSLALVIPTTNLGFSCNVCQWPDLLLWLCRCCRCRLGTSALNHEQLLMASPGMAHFAKVHLKVEGSNSNPFPKSILVPYARQ